MEEVFIIMRGQDRNTGTVHLLLTKMVARCFVCCGLILIHFRHISQACFTQLYHWSAQKVEVFPMLILRHFESSQNWLQDQNKMKKTLPVSFVGHIVSNRRVSEGHAASIPIYVTQIAVNIIQFFYIYHQLSEHFI